MNEFRQALFYAAFQLPLLKIEVSFMVLLANHKGLLRGVVQALPLI